MEPQFENRLYPTTYLHIGQPKTGTTSIQYYLHQHRETLANQGIYIPQELLGYDSASHYMLNIYSLDQERGSYMKEKLIENRGHAYVEKLKAALPEAIEKTYRRAREAGREKVIWSNEGLYLLNSQSEYERLLKLFLPYSCKVILVCCFREFRPLRKAYVQELKKNGRPLSDNKNSYRYVKKDSWLWDEQGKKDLLNTTFSDTVFFDYDPHDNVKAFIQAIGMKLSATSTPRLNVTPNGWWERFLRKGSMD